MSAVLDNFEICSSISEGLKQVIKIIHVFDDIDGYNVLFITSDDKVFGFGSNHFGCCGLGHNSVVNEPQLIPELCHKNIQQFFIGWSFILCLSSCGQLYGWGLNDCGQLGQGVTNNKPEYLKPNLINFPHGTINQISCGAAHTLLLTSDEHIYGWGDNVYGQVGCGMDKGEQISMPTKLDLQQIKSIYCSFCRSFALTANGLVYTWGSNFWCSLGHEIDRDKSVFKPMLVNITSVKCMCLSGVNTYFLTNEGQLYFCGPLEDGKNCQLFQKSPKLLSCEISFITLKSVSNYQNGGETGLAISEKAIYYLYFDSIYEGKSKSLLEFYAKENKITYETIAISQEQINLESNIQEYKGRMEDEKYFQDQFSILRELGSGGFGTVYEVRNNISYTHFAVKKIKFEEISEIIQDDLLREVHTLGKCSGQYVVQYFDSWIQNNNCLFIQMELMSDNLKNTIQDKQDFFGRKPLEPMNTIEYFISCQLFKELLECVQYLHDNGIMHRDLKPANVLVNGQPIGGRFLKLCDFGFAKLDSLATMSHTRGQGTPRYMAPEMNSPKSKYNNRVDVYSLGVIAQDIFDFDINYPGKITDNDKLQAEWRILEGEISSMMNLKFKERPTCSVILKTFQLWSISHKELDYKQINDLNKGNGNLTSYFFINFLNYLIGNCCINYLPSYI